jgi:hypothetical protein
LGMLIKEKEFIEEIWKKRQAIAGKGRNPDSDPEDMISDMEDDGDEMEMKFTELQKKGSPNKG